ncbi:hypothetical protein ACFLWU_00780 [Chloroflexota bacterium]
MGDIKSAAEIAREKIAQIGEATEEERLKWKYVPDGEKLAARYFKEDYNFTGDINNYEEKVRKYIVEGASDILIRNIRLPKNDILRRDNQKAMEGLKAIKSDKVAIDNIYSKMRHVLDHYVKEGEEQKKQAYESLKAEIEAKIQQAIKQQTGANSQMKIDVERQPQFQEEWKRLQVQLDAQYLKLLDEYKQELATIA